MRLRAPFIVSAVALSATLLPALAGVTTATADPLADPGANVAPSFTFTSACDRQLAPASAALDACIEAAVPDFDAARASEGLGPIVLPDDLDTLSPTEALLAITNVERVDRGLVPASGLSSALNPLTGAPGAVTADTPSPLLAVFDWLYDDGPAWSDRHVVLAALAGPVVMGASAFDSAVSEQLSGSDVSHLVDAEPTWSEIAATRTFGLDPASRSLTVDTGATSSFTVTVTSAETAQLTVAMVHGAPAWSVSEPKTCAVLPAASCVFTLNFTPPGPGRYPGVLAVSDGANGKTVAVVGDELAPAVSMTLGRTKVSTGSGVTVHGLVQDPQTGAALRGVQVSMQRKLAPGYPWQTLAVTRSGALGRATFHLSPLGTAAYRLALVGPTGTIESKSPAQKVRVVS
ncbi:MAG TPA: hypothetical protein VHV76_13250 [Mycobacteriales bacterium]|nr:hypothetical protein [Mycobacteriales bacterium]